MAVKICFVCDQPITRGEPRLEVSGVIIHEYCAVESGNVCDTPGCESRWLVHGGPCELQ